MITSTSNSQVKEIIQINTKGKARRESGLFVTEGIRMFREAPADRIEKIYASESFSQNEAHARVLEEKLAQCGKDRLELVSDRVFAALSDTKTPQGVLCLVRQYRYGLDDLLQKPSPCVMVLENLQDPGNLGTILRAGEGAGISGVLMNRGCVDIYNPKTIRSTTGSVYRVPFCYTEDLAAGIAKLKKAGIPVFAAHLQGSCAYDEPDYHRGCAFLIGNEGNGLTEETAALADQYIRIPMEGQVESLNAGVASALLMYEAFRQRRQG